MNAAQELEPQSCAQAEKQVTTELTLREMRGASKHARYEQTQKAIDRRKRYREKRREAKVASLIASCRVPNECPIVLRVGVGEQDVALDRLLVNAFDLQKSPAERLLADLSSRISGKGRKLPVTALSVMFPDDEPLFFLPFLYPRVLGGPSVAPIYRRTPACVDQQIKSLNKAPVRTFPSRVWGGERLNKGYLPRFAPPEVKAFEERVQRQNASRLLQQAAALGGVA